MAKKKMGRPHVEYIQRTIAVKAVQMHVDDRIYLRRSDRPGGDAWLSLRGMFDEPVNGRSEVEISIHELDEETSADSRTKSIGALMPLNPNPHIVLDMPRALFERAWAMAAGGRLLHVWISMTKPVKRHALVVSVSFSNEAME